jgi:Fe-S oxidoreductase
MSEIEKILEHCLADDCKQCMTECEFLRRFCDSPKGFAKDFLAGAFNEKPQALFCCNLCDWCETVCPEDINVGRMCLEARRAVVDSGAAPLGGHKLVLKDQEFVRSDEFTLMIPNPEKRKVRRVFFPGCHLSSYSPSLVTSTYEWLLNKDPDTGIILGCCGAPTNGMGFLSDFKEMVSDLEAEVERMGAEEIITACPNCYRTLGRFSDKLNPTSLYDVMAEDWNEGVINTAEGGVFNLHDPCAGRFHTSSHDSVRTLVKYTGAKIEELAHIREDTRCCGTGGMVAYTSPELSGTLAKRRVAGASHDLLTYCASCQRSLSGQKPTLHILDLIFNPNWREDRDLPPNTPTVKRENQKTLWQTLQDTYKDDLLI